MPPTWSRTEVSWSPPIVDPVHIVGVGLNTDGLSIHDAIATAGLTLVVVGSAGPDVGVFEQHARRHDIPLEITAVPDEFHDLFQADLLLVRPDLHVAWRGGTARNAQQVLAVATGRGTADRREKAASR